MPTVTAMEHNPVIKAFAARLARKGKAKGVILVAAMRKLLHLAYGVRTHQRPFDPHDAGARGERGAWARPVERWSRREKGGSWSRAAAGDAQRHIDTGWCKAVQVGGASARVRRAVQRVRVGKTRTVEGPSVPNVGGVDQVQHLARHEPHRTEYLSGLPDLTGCGPQPSGKPIYLDDRCILALFERY